ncbi:hypothetical protein ACS386_09310 [Flavobacteriaceae bacterium LMO-SS05]
MKRIIFLLLIVVIYSCKSKPKSDLKFESSFGMYSILINEFNGASFDIEKEVRNQVDSLNNSNIPNSDFNDYDNLTKNYISYLDSIVDQLIKDSGVDAFYEDQQTLTETKHVNNFFFQNGKYSLNGTAFIDKTNAYREMILRFVNNQNLTERINNTLDTRDIKDRNGNLIKSLDYYFKDQSLIGTIAYLKNRKKNVLEFEKEFLIRHRKNK